MVCALLGIFINISVIINHKVDKIKMLNFTECVDNCLGQ